MKFCSKCGFGVDLALSYTIVEGRLLCENCYLPEWKRK